MKPIQDCRDAYANFVVRSAGSSDARLIAAFAATERERFLGPPPWPIFAGPGHGPALSDDPRMLL